MTEKETHWPYHNLPVFGFGYLHRNFFVVVAYSTLVLGSTFGESFIVLDFFLGIGNRACSLDSLR